MSIPDGVSVSLPNPDRKVDDVATTAVVETPESTAAVLDDHAAAIDDHAAALETQATTVAQHAGLLEALRSDVDALKARLGL